MNCEPAITDNQPPPAHAARPDEDNGAALRSELACTMRAGALICSQHTSYLLRWTTRGT